MSRNIFLTSLDVLDSGKALQYYSVKSEFGFKYCEVMQSMEATTKFILSQFPIDEILVIGEEGSSGDVDFRKSIRLRDASTSYADGTASLSAFSLYQYRIAQYIGEMNLEQQAYDTLLPEEVHAKLIDFVHNFQDKYSEQEIKRLNRLFDELARNRQLYERFKNELFNTVPEARENYTLTMKWIQNYLYAQLKPTAKLEILPVNENIKARYIPASMLGKRDYWFDSILEIDQDVPDDNDEMNLFISFGNDSVIDAHLVQNVLNIMVSTPGSKIHLKKIYKVSESSAELTGEIKDNTTVTLTTDLVAAAHAFLNYNKTDMLVDFWKNCGGNDERINRLIYAARHVDVGISMCNIMEVQEGIQQLRALFRNEHSWTENGAYGLLFGIIAGCIQADYRTLLEGDGMISFIELIKWAYRHQLYQQVLTLIESHAPTNIVNSGVFYYCDDEQQMDNVTKLFALQRLELKPFEYYKLDDIAHYFVKNYDRSAVKLNGSKGEDRTLAYAILRAKSIENRDPAKISGHTACNNIETVQNVLYAYFHLGVVRNKISHADYDAMAERRLIVSESDESFAMVLMKQSIEYFIMCYEKAIKEIEGKKSKIVTITSEDVRNAAENMKRERNHNYERTNRREDFRQSEKPEETEHSSGQRPARRFYGRKD